MAIKQRPDSPTNNFATLNPLVNGSGGASISFSEGNLKYDASSNPEAHFTMNADNYYFEFVDLISNSNASLYIVGASDPGVRAIPYYNISNHARIDYLAHTTGIDNRGTANLTVTNGTLFNMLYNYVISVYKKDKSTLILSSVGTSETVEIDVDGLVGDDFIIVLTNYTSSRSTSYRVNFGQDPTFGGTKTPSGGTNSDGSYPDKSTSGIGGFFYEPPAGAKALCTANLQEMTPTVADDVPKDYFKAVEYSGGSKSISVGLQPDLVWIKSRNSGMSHVLSDSLRGNGKFLSTNGIGPEESDSSKFNQFESNGFSVGSHGGVSSSSQIAWCWKAGGAPTANNSNTSGAMTANSVSLNGTLQSSYTPSGSPTIYPTRMSINTDAGFSIVEYTGTETSSQTIPHGLSERPDFVISKSLGTGNWGAWHTNLSGNSYYLGLNQTVQEYSNTTVFHNFTDEIIGVGSDVRANATDGVIACCWHSVEGYSKFGSYAGNGSTDGPFVYCGFRPAFVIVKRIDAAQSWAITDNKRTTSHNPVNGILLAESFAAEQILVFFDFLSNGFKARQSYTGLNASGGTYIYMAFAEQPFNYANAR